MQFFMQFPLIHINIPVYYVIQQHNNIPVYYVIQHAQQQGYHYVPYIVDSVVGIKARTLCRQRVDNVCTWWQSLLFGGVEFIFYFNLF